MPSLRPPRVPSAHDHPTTAPLLNPPLATLPAAPTGGPSESGVFGPTCSQYHVFPIAQVYMGPLVWPYHTRAATPPAALLCGRYPTWRGMEPTKPHRILTSRLDGTLRGKPSVGRHDQPARFPQSPFKGDHRPSGTRTRGDRDDFQSGPQHADNGTRCRGTR